MSFDTFHHGHTNIIEKAREYGDVTIGLLTDLAIGDHKRIPYLNYDKRKYILENIKGVKEVVPQNEWDYSPNLKKYKPDYMIHGDDWLSGPLSLYRSKAIKALDEIGAKLIEIPYTRDVSSSDLSKNINSSGIGAETRKSRLKRLLKAKKILRFIEAHSPISALIAENATITTEDKVLEFDGFWSSSLTDSTEMGKPDIEALHITTRFNNINNIFDVTTKPLIMDIDTGGRPEHFGINVKSAERLGISAFIMEDKTGLKKNSLLGNEVDQSLEEIDIFCEKIKVGVANKMNNDFMIIARLESLILEKGMDDALKRARAYIAAGIDGIMIHSRKEKPDEIYEFAKNFRNEFENIPLVSVPTSYNCVKESELAEKGFNIVIYANQLMRGSCLTMDKVAHSILKNGRSLEIDKDIISVKEILNLIPGTN